MVATMPNRSGCVDDVLGRQIDSRRDRRLTGTDRGEAIACGLHAVRSRRAENRAAYPSTHHEVRIRRVDNGIHMHAGDVLMRHGKWHNRSSLTRMRATVRC